MSALNIAGDTAASLAFLDSMYPRDLRHLIGIHADGRVEAKTFEPTEGEKTGDWIEGRQGRTNLYYHGNWLRDGVRDRKARKADIFAGLFLHVDVDDPTALVRIQNYSPRPTVIVFSGGGYQALWQLREPCFDLQLVEDRNRAIAQHLGGDNCHNIDRILRLPGTINIPNAKKRRAGRVEALSYVV